VGEREGESEKKRKSGKTRLRKPTTHAQEKAEREHGRDREGEFVLCVSACVVFQVGEK